MQEERLKILDGDTWAEHLDQGVFCGLKSVFIYAIYISHWEEKSGDKLRIAFSTFTGFQTAKHAKKLMLLSRLSSKVFKSLSVPLQAYGKHDDYY